MMWAVERGKMIQSDRVMITDALRALFAAHWPVEDAVRRAGDRAAVATIWQALQAQGFGEVGASDGLGLEAGLLLAEEAGRAGCPAPIIPTVAINLLGIRREETIATALDAEGMTLSGGRLSGKIRFVEHAAIARSVAVAVAGGVAVVPLDAAALVFTPGLSVPPLADLRYDLAPAEFIASASVADAALAERLMLASRALGAAHRAFELLLDHVLVRVQFGRVLARFQSMQHKLADCKLVLDCATLQLADAARRYDAGDAGWHFAGEAALAYAAGNLRRVSLETHHGFGAIGYAEEHEAPRHFRRVHADLARMGGVRRARAALAGHMVEGPGRFPDHHLGDQVEAFRAGVRAWLAAHWSDAERRANRARPFVERGRNANFERALGAAGYLSLGWPVAHGGQAARPLNQMVLMEELERAEAPTSGIIGGAWLLAPEIIRHGSPFLQEALLPGIARGEIKFALGYSEPEAGSDLTSLRTRAVREGDHYVVTGQKLWGTGTEHATHIALAVRTDPDASSKAQGISLLIVPTDLPGITIQPNMAMYGHSFCTQFYDAVRVPAEYLLGTENGGWAVLSGALAAERISMGGQVARVCRIFEEFCGYVAARPALAGDPLVRDMIGQYAAEQAAARQLTLRSLLALEAGRMPLVEGAITKVFSGDLTERFCEAALDILGIEASLGEETPDAPLDGQVEQLLRRSIMLVIGGGAPEIQKTIIAQRGLGLPR